MSFNPNIPLSTDILSDSQVDLLNNNTANNTWSSVDHYSLANLTSNNGFHLHVTTPTPSNSTHYTTTLNTLLYGMQDNAAIGNIQYSRGPNDAVPSPVTTLQSSSAGISITSNSSVTILNFNPSPTPLPYCYGYLIAIGQTSSSTVIGSSGIFFWNGSNAGTTYATSSSAQLQFSFSGTNLILYNAGSNLTNVAWTLRFERIWTPT